MAKNIILPNNTYSHRRQKKALKTRCRTVVHSERSITIRHARSEAIKIRDINSELLRQENLDIINAISTLQQLRASSK